MTLEWLAPVKVGPIKAIICSFFIGFQWIIGNVITIVMNIMVRREYSHHGWI